jgi:hypothetical protein
MGFTLYMNNLFGNFFQLRFERVLCMMLLTPLGWFQYIRRGTRIKNSVCKRKVFLPRGSFPYSPSSTDEGSGFQSACKQWDFLL